MTTNYLVYLGGDMGERTIMTERQWPSVIHSLCRNWFSEDTRAEHQAHVAQCMAELLPLEDLPADWTFEDFADVTMSPQARAALRLAAQGWIKDRKN